MGVPAWPQVRRPHLSCRPNPPVRPKPLRGRRQGPLVLQHRLEQIAELGDAPSATSIVKSRGRSPGTSSSQRSGVDTGAPGFGRTEYTDAIVLPQPFWR